MRIDSPIAVLLKVSGLISNIVHPGEKQRLHPPPEQAIEFAFDEFRDTLIA